MRIGKKKLTKLLSEESSLSQKDAEAFLKTLDSLVKEALFHGDSVVLPGLISLSVASVSERTRYNPHTKEKMVVPAKKVVRCRVSSALQKRLEENYVPSIVMGWVGQLSDLKVLQVGFAQIGCSCSFRGVLDADELKDIDAAIIGPDCPQEQVDGFVEEVAEAKQNLLVIRFVKQMPAKDDKPYRYLPWRTLQMPADQNQVEGLFSAVIKPDIWGSGNHLFRCRVAIRSEVENVSRLREYLASFLVRVIKKDLVPDVLKGILEGLDNAIQHGNNQQPDLLVEMGMRVTRDRLFVRIMDEGAGFEHEEYLSMLETKDSAEIVEDRRVKKAPRPGGLGIPLMLQVFDTVTFEGKGNVVQLEKSFKPVSVEARSIAEAAAAGAAKEADAEDGIEEVEEVELSDAFATGQE